MNRSGESSQTDLVQVLADSLTELNLRDKISDPKVSAHFIDVLREEMGIPRLACRAVYWWAIVPAAGGIDTFVERQRGRAAGWAARIGARVLENLGNKKLLDYLRTAAERAAGGSEPSSVQPITANDLESLR